MSKKSGFLDFLVKKLKHNKEIIGLIISSCILAQTLVIYLSNGTIKSWINKYYVYVIIFFIIILIVVFTGILLYFTSDKLHSSYEEFSDINCFECNKRSVEIINHDEYKKKMNIYSLTYLEQIERNMPVTEQVWILTSDTKLETTVSNISKILKDNLNKGISYNYFIPDTLKNRATILELENKYGHFPNFNLIKINNKYKLLFEKIDVSIYYPTNDKRQGFISINFSDADESHYYKKFSDEDLRIIIGRLIQIMEE